MAWGSNISEVRFNAPVIEFDPATWSQIGQRKREEDRKTKATESVAMARKEIRDRFQTKRENEAYTSTKSQLEAQLKQAESELKEIDNQIAETRAIIARNQAEQEKETQMTQPGYVANTTDPSARGFNRSFSGFTQPQTKPYAPDYSEMPIFGQKRGGMQ